jgi:glutamyl-tRNA reductase
MTRHRATAEAAAEAVGDEPAGTTADAAVEGDAAVERIRKHATAVRDAEVETALAKLDADGDLSATEREAVERLADGLVDSLLAVPEESLHAAAAAGDDETVETALELFG